MRPIDIIFFALVGLSALMLLRLLAEYIEAGLELVCDWISYYWKKWRKR